MTPESVLLEARLTRLERANRRLMIAVALLLIAGLTLGLSGRLGAAGSEPAQGELVAERLIIRDSSGVTRAVLACDLDPWLRDPMRAHEPGLVLLDSDGRPLAALRTLMAPDHPRASAGGALGLWAPSAAPDQGRVDVEILPTGMMIRRDGSVLAGLTAGVISKLALQDVGGRGEAGIGVSQCGPFVSLRDSTGSVFLAPETDK